MIPNGQSSARTALILYGSESGTAQNIAEEIGRLTERLHFISRVVELNSISIVSWNNLITKYVRALSLTLLPLGRAFKILCCYILYLDDRSRRFTKERASLLEEVKEQAIAGTMLIQSALHCLRDR